MSLCVIVSNKNPNFSIYSALHLRFYYYVYFLLYCLLLRADLSRSYYCSLTCSSTTLIQPYYLLSMQRAILLPFLLFVHATSHFATRSCNQLFCYSFMQPAILLLVHATSYSATRSCNQLFCYSFMQPAILLLVHATMQLFCYSFMQPAILLLVRAPILIIYTTIFYHLCKTVYSSF
jgi:hypothetical protein